MGFFDKIKDVADTVVDSVEKGAKNVSETSKKTADKMKIKKEINNIPSDKVKQIVIDNLEKIAKGSRDFRL